MTPKTSRSEWLEIIKHLKEQTWMSKFYSTEGGWAYISKRDGTRLKIDNTWFIDEVKTLVQNIKKTYEN